MMKLTFLGTGTSDGVPLLGCHCPVCLSTDPHDKRLRTALYLEDGSNALLLDAGPDLRYQALRSNISHFDAILISHQHADHTGGLAEMRRFNQLMANKTIDLYANQETINDLTIKYDYFFNPTQKGGGYSTATL